MGQGNRHDHGVKAVQIRHGYIALHIGYKIIVGQHHAFSNALCTGCEQNNCHVIGLAPAIRCGQCIPFQDV